jgi:hypothetical protein
MKSKLSFRTIAFEESDKLLDYPQNIPLPRKGETIIYESYAGIVSDIRHNISGTMSEIKIIVQKN